MIVSFFIFYSFCLFLIFLDPRASNLITLLHILSPQVENVCYKFTDWIEAMDNIEEIPIILNPRLCSFKYFTILAPIQEPSSNQITPLRLLVQDLYYRFNLYSCLLQFYDKTFIYEPKLEKQKELLDEWIQLIDEDVVPYLNLV